MDGEIRDIVIEIGGQWPDWNHAWIVYDSAGIGTSSDPEDYALKLLNRFRDIHPNLQRDTIPTTIPTHHLADKCLSILDYNGVTFNVIWMISQFSLPEETAKRLMWILRSNPETLLN